jgi:putative membrane protein
MQQILMTFESQEKRKHLILLASSFLVLLWSSYKPYDFLSWVLLAIPPLVYILLLTLTYKKFRFTTLTYTMVFIHITILLIGAKYTYTYNPLFDVVKDVFNSNRNNYDRVGHLAQGFIPTFLVKEFILRKGYLQVSRFFYHIVYACILAFSAFYELLEFVACLIIGNPGYIMGYQGDPWDTQWDMLMAITGATIALLIFGKLHDKMMKKLEDQS